MSARLSPLLVLLLAAPALISPGRSAAQIVGNIGFGLGGKWRSEPSYWNQVRDEGIPEITASLFLGHSALPVVLTGYVARTRQDVRSDTADDARFRQTNYETALGLAGIWSLGPLRPYAATGIARISSRTERTDIDTDAEAGSGSAPARSSTPSLASTLGSLVALPTWTTTMETISAG